MLYEIKGIKIKGANYPDISELSFFYDDNEKNDYRALLLYGRNGSGKSTIAKGFNNIKNIEDDPELYAEFLLKDNEKIAVDDSLLSNIHVFNEDYIDKNIKLSEDGIGTIVMLGERIDLEEKLEFLKNNETTKNEEYEKQKILINQYNDNNNKISPNYWKKETQNKLRGDDNWAGREKIIRNLKTNAKVDYSICTKIINRNPKNSRNNLLIEFENNLKRYLKLADENTDKVSKPQLNRNVHIDQKHLLGLLQRKVENPNLTERDKIILTFGYDRLEEIRESLKEKDVCPYCLQDVSQKQKDLIFEVIEKVLNNDVEKYRVELEKSKIDVIQIDFSKYEAVDLELTLQCKKDIESFNNEVCEVNAFIEQKINKPFEYIKIPHIEIENKFEKMNVSIKNLQKACDQYNYAIDNKNKLKEKLLDLNADIAYYDINSIYQIFQKQQSKFEKESKKLVELKKDLKIIQDKINKLEGEKENLEVAKNLINKGLKYVFFSNNRLTLEYSNCKYYLKSNNKPVKPSQISTGERNILALCYFFSEIMKGKDKEDAYKSNYLLVLDDPVTSFDFENRIGLLSYLKYQLNRFIKQNDKTKILIMTHDIQTMYDMDKYMKEIKKGVGKERFKYICKELRNGKLESFNIKKWQEYTNYLEIIYNYAKEKNIEKNNNKEAFIGNIMRKVLEAFSTFTYKVGISELSTDPDILNSIDKDLASYFENLMYRLVLNNDSHYEDRVLSGNNVDFFEYTSPMEKQITAKSIICMLYCLNKQHVLSHLKSIVGVEEVIENWKKDIQNLT